jgi:hypothetical protein
MEGRVKYWYLAGTINDLKSPPENAIFVDDQLDVDLTEGSIVVPRFVGVYQCYDFLPDFSRGDILTEEQAKIQLAKGFEVYANMLRNEGYIDIFPPNLIHVFYEPVGDLRSGLVREILGDGTGRIAVSPFENGDNILDFTQKNVSLEHTIDKIIRQKGLTEEALQMAETDIMLLNEQKVIYGATSPERLTLEHVAKIRRKNAQIIIPPNEIELESYVCEVPYVDVSQ